MKTLSTIAHMMPVLICAGFFVPGLFTILTRYKKAELNPNTSQGELITHIIGISTYACIAIEALFIALNRLKEDDSFFTLLWMVLIIFLAITAFVPILLFTHDIAEHGKNFDALPYWTTTFGGMVYGVLFFLWQKTPFSLLSISITAATFSLCGTPILVGFFKKTRAAREKTKKEASYSKKSPAI